MCLAFCSECGSRLLPDSPHGNPVLQASTEAQKVRRSSSRLSEELNVVLVMLLYAAFWPLQCTKHVAYLAGNPRPLIGELLTCMVGTKGVHPGESKTVLQDAQSSELHCVFVCRLSTGTKRCGAGDGPICTTYITVILHTPSCLFSNSSCLTLSKVDLSGKNDGAEAVW